MLKEYLNDLVFLVAQEAVAYKHKIISRQRVETPRHSLGRVGRQKIMHADRAGV